MAAAGWLATSVSAQPRIDLWLVVAPFEHPDLQDAVVVKPQIAGHGLDSLRFLLSATLDVGFDGNRYTFRAATGEDVAGFVADWQESCAAAADPMIECSSLRPYQVTHSSVAGGARGPRVRTLVYAGLGHAPGLGEPGLVLLGDTVALSTLFFFRRSTDNDDSSTAGDPSDGPDSDPFWILEPSTAIGIYAGRDEQGGIGMHVDCKVGGERCLLKVHPPFFPAAAE